MAASGVIKTSEPIKIEWKISDGMMVITVDGTEYATIDNIHSQNDVDARFMNNLKHWIEETYYSDDYKSSAYIPPMLNKKEFGGSAHAKTNSKLEDVVNSRMGNATFLRSIPEMLEAAKVAIRVGHMQEKPKMVKFNALVINYLNAIHKKDTDAALKGAAALVKAGYGEAFGLK